MLDLAQNSPPRAKLPTPTIMVVPQKNKIYFVLNTACTRIKKKITGPLPISEKNHPHSILQVPTTQLAKVSIDPKFVEATADVVTIFL